MTKMTKAQAKKRLSEAARKVANVWANFNYMSGGMSPADVNKLVKIHSELTRLARKGIK